MPNLMVGDVVSVNGHRYALEKRLGGGFQFRTWLVREIGGSGQMHVAKLTRKWDLAAREIGAYMFLSKKGLPGRYYSKLVAFDYDCPVIRVDTETQRLVAILLKHYPYTLGSFLQTGPTVSEVAMILRKLERRVKALHKVGFVHGDLHEGNILIRRTNRGIGVLLIDLASSRYGDKKAMTKEIRKLGRLVCRIRARLAGVPS